MDEIEHTIAELMDIPMEEWTEWLERRQLPVARIHAIEQWLIGTDAVTGSI